MDLLLCGGGTAGHVEPALAIAELMKKRIPTLDIGFIGREGGEENRRVESLGYRIHYIPMRGLQRKLSLRQLSTLRLTLRGIREMKAYLKQERPRLVVGTGGYVCFPVVYAASSLGIPTVLHESNAIPGLAVRLLSRRVTKILCNLKGTEDAFRSKAKVVCVGMPVRSSISTVGRAKARHALGIQQGELLLVSFGGSLGAQRINEVCLNFMADFSASTKNIHHIHGCGRRYYDEVKARYPFFCQEGGRCRIFPYLDNMAELLRAADLVICRSGAATLAELCAAQAPAILIPSENVTDDHQRKNAKRLQDAGACCMITENDLCYDTLKAQTVTLLTDAVARLRMRRALDACFDKNTDEKIFFELSPFLVDKLP